MHRDNRKWKPDGSRDYYAEWQACHWMFKASVIFIGFFWFSFIVVEIMPLLWR